MSILMHEIQKRLTGIKGFLIDLDGTLYRGEQAIPGAKEFVQWMQHHGKRYLFVTNNSAVYPQQVAKKLQRLGIPAKEEDIFTSSQATAMYIKEREQHAPEVQIIGEEGLRTALEEHGCQLVEEGGDYVVVGLDRQFTYEKMRRACEAIRQGAVFIGTNPDKCLPTERGLAPGAGSLIQAVACAVGKDPIWIGKPEARMIAYGMEKIGTDRASTVMLGDNLDTDILAGVRAGIRTVLVLTGYSRREDVDQAKAQPTAVFTDLRELLQHLEGQNE